MYSTVGPKTVIKNDLQKTFQTKNKSNNHTKFSYKLKAKENNES